MGAILKLLTGTSQGATPVQDGTTRAAYVTVLNAVLLVGCHLIHLTDADTLIVVALSNPLAIIVFSLVDKADAIIQASKGITTAPTPTKSEFDTPHD